MGNDEAAQQYVQTVLGISAPPQGTPAYSQYQAIVSQISAQMSSSSGGARPASSSSSSAPAPSQPSGSSGGGYSGGASGGAAPSSSPEEEKRKIAEITTFMYKGKVIHPFEYDALPEREKSKVEFVYRYHEGKAISPWEYQNLSQAEKEKTSAWSYNQSEILRMDREREARGETGRYASGLIDIWKSAPEKARAEAALNQPERLAKRPAARKEGALWTQGYSQFTGDLPGYEGKVGERSELDPEQMAQLEALRRYGKSETGVVSEADYEKLKDMKITTFSAPPAPAKFYEEKFQELAKTREYYLTELSQEGKTPIFTNEGIFLISPENKIQELAKTREWTDITYLTAFPNIKMDKDVVALQKQDLSGLHYHLPGTDITTTPMTEWAQKYVINPIMDISFFGARKGLGAKGKDVRASVAIQRNIESAGTSGILFGYGPSEKSFKDFAYASAMWIPQLLPSGIEDSQKTFHLFSTEGAPEREIVGQRISGLGKLPMQPYKFMTRHLPNSFKTAGPSPEEYETLSTWGGKLIEASPQLLAGAVMGIGMMKASGQLGTAAEKIRVAELNRQMKLDLENKIPTGVSFTGEAYGTGGYRFSAEWRMAENPGIKVIEGPTPAAYGQQLDIIRGGVRYTVSDQAGQANLGPRWTLDTMPKVLTGEVEPGVSAGNVFKMAEPLGEHYPLGYGAARSLELIAGQKGFIAGEISPILERVGAKGTYSVDVKMVGPQEITSRSSIISAAPKGSTLPAQHISGIFEPEFLKGVQARGGTYTGITTDFTFTEILKAIKEAEARRAISHGDITGFESLPPHVKLLSAQATTVMMEPQQLQIIKTVSLPQGFMESFKSSVFESQKQTARITTGRGIILPGMRTETRTQQKVSEKYGLSLELGAGETIEKVREKTLIRPGPRTIHIEKTKEKPVIRPFTQDITIELQKQKQIIIPVMPEIEITLQKQRIIPGIIIPEIEIGKPEKPKPPPEGGGITLPTLGFSSGLTAFHPDRGVRRLTQYAPSLTAITFGIKGKVNEGNLLSGFELRPIPVMGRTKKKKRR